MISGDRRANWGHGVEGFVNVCGGDLADTPHADFLKPIPKRTRKVGLS
jgi:hypothetical protein